MAEQVERPQVATTPLDLFENRYSVDVPFLNKYWIPAVSATIAFTAVCYANWATKRPVLSGLQKHLAYSAGAAYVGKLLDNWKDDNMAEKDAMLKDYIRLHPEEFPAFERKKYSEVLDRWTPVR